MNETSLTLLNCLQQSNEPESWDRLVTLYGPLLTVWLRKYDVQPSDSDDLVQDVLMAVTKGVRDFDHNGRPGAFRVWLRTIMVNRLRNFWRTRARGPQAGGGSEMERKLAELDDPASDMSRLWNQQHDLHVAQQLLALAELNFTPETWTVFERVAIAGERADLVAAEMGMTLNAVFVAKSRVLSRLRLEAAGLMETDSGFPAKR